MIAKTYEGIGKVLYAYELSVNSTKLKILLMKPQNKEKPCITYSNESLKNLESSKYLGLEVPSNHRWNEFASRCLQAGKRAYYAVKNICNGGETTCWILKNTFSTRWYYQCFSMQLKGRYHLQVHSYKCHIRSYFLRPDHF